MMVKILSLIWGAQRLMKSTTIEFDNALNPDETVDWLAEKTAAKINPTTPGGRVRAMCQAKNWLALAPLPIRAVTSLLLFKTAFWFAA